MNRRTFSYTAPPEKIREYIYALGFKTEDHYTRNLSEPTGFTVSNTTVEVSYPPVIRGRVVGLGGVGLSNESDTSSDVAKISLSLFRRLREKFAAPAQDNRDARV
jgi:hypothetical protein